ncbi:MAG: K(+)-transporting ATPase subunit F [Myxococcota bacterium]
MEALLVLGGIVSALLGLYLFIALMFPEKLQ